MLKKNIEVYKAMALTGSEVWKEYDQSPMSSALPTMRSALYGEVTSFFSRRAGRRR